MSDDSGEKQKKNLLEALDKFSGVFQEAMDDAEKQSEEFWNSLSYFQQIDAFCAVVRRIHKGEIEEKGSYRYVLYDVFNFEPDAYALAQMAGYLDLHNSIYTEEDIKNHVIRMFKEKNGNYMDILTELTRILDEERKNEQ